MTHGIANIVFPGNSIYPTFSCADIILFFFSLQQPKRDQIAKKRERKKKKILEKRINRRIFH